MKILPKEIFWMRDLITGLRLKPLKNESNFYHQKSNLLFKKLECSVLIFFCKNIDYQIPQWKEESKSAKTKQTQTVPPKLGPRDIGQNMNYNLPAWSQEIDEKVKTWDIYKERYHPRRNSESKQAHGYSASAPETESASNYTLPEWIDKIEEQLKGFNSLEERPFHSDLKKREDMHVEPKLGPREIGKNKHYQGTEYEDERYSRRDFLEEQMWYPASEIKDPYPVYS
ncbi:hypothetical protein RFI_32717 [Reticulomyxa filosa]|uniref:Uncharacterized protein n=1 Tax=Reticulomyxa filosa TaxID=46433 RepID=X6LU60_RETFI|nr:hypothetical protein RFI_32717 [Reticulomyxa filosa]|eukprot:ETO04682.1 hypothetical protein RFI_32717 [Reticulomyxa filosa]